MQLRLLCANMWLLPARLSVDNQKRVNDLICYIQKTMPDVVTLQEVWPLYFVNQIKKQLPEYYPTTGKPGIFNLSGLMTLSRIRPNHVNHNYFQKTKMHNLIEKLANKGCLTISLRLAKGELFINNVQLYSATLPHENRIVRDQFCQLKNITHTGNHIVAGDFNITPARLLKINKNHFQFSSWKASTICHTNPYQHRRVNRFYKNGKRLDYILLRSPGNIRLQTRILKKLIISDHYALLGTISL